MESNKLEKYSFNKNSCLDSTWLQLKAQQIIFKCRNASLILQYCASVVLQLVVKVQQQIKLAAMRVDS